MFNLKSQIECNAGSLAQLKLTDRESKELHRHGFIARYKMKSLEKLSVCHTVGFTQLLGHREFEIADPVTKSDAIKVLHRIAGKIYQEGAWYAPLQSIDLGGLKLNLIESQRGYEELIRIIFPDPNGCLDRNRMTPEYAAQYCVER